MAAASQFGWANFEVEKGGLTARFPALFHLPPFDAEARTLWSSSPPLWGVRGPAWVGVKAAGPTLRLPNAESIMKISSLSNNQVRWVVKSNKRSCTIGSFALATSFLVPCGYHPIHSGWFGVDKGPIGVVLSLDHPSTATHSLCCFWSCSQIWLSDVTWLVLPQPFLPYLVSLRRMNQICGLKWSCQSIKSYLHQAV